MKPNNRKAMFAGFEKRSGLNKVTVQSLGQNRYQANMNGKGAYMPATESLVKDHLRQMIQDAKFYDRQGKKI